MIIYQVFESGYDQNDLLGTFTTRKLANDFVKLCSRGRDEIENKLTRIHILTVKVKDTLPYPVDTKFYTVTIDINGNARAELITLSSFESFITFKDSARPIVDYPQDKDGNYLRTKDGYLLEIYTGEIDFYVMAPNESAAITEALKRAAKWKKKNKWPIAGENKK
ncbi:MAG: hypothetical protein EKK57_04935 [Proteobacteria bacterium]|nr:MAG: hypothetical protein EKK57_04935 [Pseudomonadota bacterium]